ncbi:MAG: hypothetical protein WDM96_04260 [Lacunisphaera sp.]
MRVTPLRPAARGLTFARAGHVIAVSAEYPAVLRQRYPGLPAERFTVLPFGAPDGDLAYLRQVLATRPAVLPAGSFRLAFAGAPARACWAAWRALLAAVAELRREGLPVSVHFYGTSYAGVGRSQPAVAGLVAKYRLGDWGHGEPPNASASSTRSRSRSRRR